jgi:hypothetical protein
MGNLDRRQKGEDEDKITHLTHEVGVMVVMMT